MIIYIYIKIKLSVFDENGDEKKIIVNGSYDVTSTTKNILCIVFSDTINFNESIFIRITIRENSIEHVIKK